MGNKKQTAREKRVFESGLKQGYENAKEVDSIFVRHTARKIDEILEYDLSPFDKTLLIKHYMDSWREADSEKDDKTNQKEVKNDN